MLNKSMINSLSFDSIHNMMFLLVSIAIFINNSNILEIQSDIVNLLIELIIIMEKQYIK